MRGATGGEVGGQRNAKRRTCKRKKTKCNDQSNTGTGNGKPPHKTGALDLSIRSMIRSKKHEIFLQSGGSSP